MRGVQQACYASAHSPWPDPASRASYVHRYSSLVVAAARRTSCSLAWVRSRFAAATRRTICPSSRIAGIIAASCCGAQSSGQAVAPAHATLAPGTNPDWWIHSLGNMGSRHIRTKKDFQGALCERRKSHPRSRRHHASCADYTYEYRNNTIVLNVNHASPQHRPGDDTRPSAPAPHHRPQAGSATALVVVLGLDGAAAESPSRLPAPLQRLQPQLHAGRQPPQGPAPWLQLGCHAKPAWLC